ncbi:Gfo/Idh/MocA family oxidoreductase [Singulisphaera sp. PoT]|uniref:Gfo/Idh/MocA family protein n=1 Tax=Singulisphaera sp. PoT TaxID=3411797 RepID=UPI003BF600FD
MADQLTRRGFMGTTGVAAASYSLGLAAVGARSARAEDPPQSAAKAPVIGLIGAGGMGRHNMGVFMDQKIPVAAVCDVDESHAREAADQVEKKQGKRPEIFKDFRKLLERKDIDAVIIGTPDHWHALASIHASDAGKDAYCEKPISHNITEGRAMVDAATRHKRVVQVGTWQRSTREFADAVAYIRSGKLGKITTCRAWKSDNNQLGHNAATNPPQGLDYDFWVGPAEMVPYTEKNCHYNWRWFFNTAAGMTGDWGVHMMDIALLGMSPDTDLVMPEEVTSYGGSLAYPGDDRTTPDTQLALMKFPGFVLHWETGRKSLDGGPDHGTEFIAADGSSLMVWRGGWTIKGPDGKEREKPKIEGEYNGLTSHVQDFLRCIETRDRPRSNLPSMYQTTAVCHLANVSLLAGKTVRWDKQKNDLVGEAGRDTLAYRREYRKPWTLPYA